MRARIEERVPFPWSVKKFLLKETQGRCAHCGVILDRYTNLSVDHVIPLNKGGTNDIQNLTVLCEDCNSTKSDMILPPVVWYPYLSTAKKKSLSELLYKYMTETDYLADDCLMPMDIFRIEVPITTKKKCPNGMMKIIRMPAYIYGTRMERNDAFDWLMEYKKSLQYRDACDIFTHPSDFPAPCYLMKKGDIEVAMVNPWMVHEWDKSMNNYRNEILMDWFFSPNLPDRDYLPEMLACMVAGVETYITQSIAKTMDGACAILFHFRCFVSDRFCNPVFNYLSEGKADKIEEFDTGKRLCARIRDLTVFNIIGKKAACMELKKKLDKQNPDGFLSLKEAAKVNEKFDRRFE